MVRRPDALSAGLPRVVWRRPPAASHEGSQKNPQLYTRGPGCLAGDSGAICRREPDRSRMTDQAHLGAPAWRMHTRAGAANSGLLHSPRDLHGTDRAAPAESWIARYARFTQRAVDQNGRKRNRRREARNTRAVRLRDKKRRMRPICVCKCRQNSTTAAYTFAALETVVTGEPVIPPDDGLLVRDPDQ